MKGRITISMATMMAIACIALTACKKEEFKNPECDIISAWVQGDEYAACFFQPSQMHIDDIPSTTTELVFTVRPASSHRLPVFFTVSEGATASPASGSVQDFSAGPVTYTVTSEDGAYSRRYTVYMRPPEAPVTISFEHVGTAVQGSSRYHVFCEINANGDTNRIWASGNQGYAITQSNATPEMFPTRSVNDGYVGKGVCLTTKDAGPMGHLMNKPIAAGNLFIGEFNINAVLTNALKSTVFGMPVNKVPTRVEGYYKYMPGAEFTNAQMQVDPNRTDEANIYAVFFRNQDDEGNPVKLYGDNVMTSPCVVMTAQVASLPATAEWTRFEMDFEGGAVDLQLLANYGYSMTLVFSSSKGGDAFEGAIGSMLYIDEVQVTYEN